jgi:hypothetical protein
MNPLRRRPFTLALALLAAAGLGYDAYVHLHLASSYDAVGDQITQGALFRLEAVVAILAAVGVLVSDSRLAWLVAGGVGLAGVVAVVLLRYVDVPAIGPIPSMYEPVWYAEKTRSAVAEVAVVGAWLVREALRLRRADRTPDAHSPM